MTDLPERDDYRQLFVSDTAMIDVRAPVEFQQGAFPHTSNLPLMNDEEREAVGIRYKELGQDKAIELGHELVCGDIKQQRIQDWEKFIKQYPDGVLYCFRGGLRSKLSQQWIYEQTGIAFPRIKGGYKALRAYLLEQLDVSSEIIQPVILGGRTGTGKTILLNQISASVDLEGIFNHRGSVFGKHVQPQPSQIDIENALSIALLKLIDNHQTTIVFEDEAPNIGSRNIPKPLFEKMKASPLILLEESVDTRVEIIFDEYITNSLQQYIDHYGNDKGFECWAEQLLQSLERVQRRLGGDRYKKINALMQAAINTQRDDGNADLHRDWINNLLVDYYDPMYDYQLTKKMHRVIFTGSSIEIREYLAAEYKIF